jgi:hypothetical protein
MNDRAEVSQELDRLITVGHQDSSLRRALRGKFPDLTDAELRASFETVNANRAARAKPAADAE